METVILKNTKEKVIVIRLFTCEITGMKLAEVKKINIDHCGTFSLQPKSILQQQSNLK